MNLIRLFEVRCLAWMKPIELLKALVLVDPMQKCLPLNYFFVRSQNSLTNKLFTIFVIKRG